MTVDGSDVPVPAMSASHCEIGKRLVSGTKLCNVMRLDGIGPASTLGMSAGSKAKLGV